MTSATEARLAGRRPRSATHPPGLWHEGLRRFLVLPRSAWSDTFSERDPAALDTREAVWERACEGVGWLCRTHDVTERRGCSKGFSLVSGWMAPFPETTGYIIGTLLAHSRLGGDGQLVERATQMGDWEIEVQNPDGGVVVGLLEKKAKPSTVFNTGMVMHGWLDLYELLGGERYLNAATRAGRYLIRVQDHDGAWRGVSEYRGVPHTYSARASWALVRLADVTGDDAFRAAARRQLDWVLAMQQENGWFESCAFSAGDDPNTHVLSYTMRGLLESGLLLEHEPYLAAARTAAERLLRRFRESGGIPATFDRDWRPSARYECVTGIAQLAGIWLLLFELTGEGAFREAGADALAIAASRQSRSGWEPIRGAVPGSYPIYGRYAPLQYPNWATKFLVDSLHRGLELFQA